MRKWERRSEGRGKLIREAVDLFRVNLNELSFSEELSIRQRGVIVDGGRSFDFTKQERGKELFLPGLNGSRVKKRRGEGGSNWADKELEFR